ncbi:hypothetical protein F0562_030930 [Nyssa sinensis]|uniref:Uncharacterized protein n=1 Tax=Nyssa sinensis TaxID=561372 RepID=A0A5J5AUS2_9ASTE|nr:hypothetical protein F0562_030930 [Nyssa sinensis]
MGIYEGWVQPTGFYPNGLLPNKAASVTRVLDQERWSTAEGRTTELISCIQPNQPSEERRNAVACYVQRLIRKCFPCEVCTFGSVPLKTYLPDGDIDLTVFSKNQNLKDTWANEVRHMLEHEEKSEDAEFCVKEVQYIQAEVKIIKCLVENIVVDISFNQLGGLCTLCFLEKVDILINQNHLFKRSVILIKAWCYYESRILGAHHGLISTYALETLVLYIFHVYNNSFAGPLEVLYRFLEFFSKFDWDKFCVSLWGPVPIADPPRKDGEELLLCKVFHDACSSVNSVFPVGQETHELPFSAKYFNVIDPLRTNNNLGRSVSKGNFFRIHSAFAFGAQRLARLLDCPKENIIAEVNQFFTNTWNRHGQGHRPDAPTPDLRPANLNHIDGSDSLKSYSSSKKVGESSISDESDIEVTHASHGGVFSQHDNQSLKQISRMNNASISHTQSQKAHAYSTSLTASHQNHQMNTSSNEMENTDKERSSRPDYLESKMHVRYQFARPHSSPELTDKSGEFSSRGRSNRASETTKGQTSSTRLDYSRRRNPGTKISENNKAISSTEDLPSSKSSFHWSSDTAVDLDSASNNYCGESGFIAMGEDQSSVAEAMQMHQEEQDFVNMMASSGVHNFGGHIPMPVNLASARLPFPVSPSILASLGYAHTNSAGIVPTNIPLFETPWGSNMHFSQGVVSVPVSQYISSVGIASNQEEIVEPIDDSLGSKETNQEDSDHALWSERDADSLRGFDANNGSFQLEQLGEKKIFSSEGFPSVPSSWVSSSESYSLKDYGLMKENRGFRKNFGENSQNRNIRGSDAIASSRFVPPLHTISSRTKQSSEGSTDGSSSKNSKSTGGRQGWKSTPTADRSTLYKNRSQYEGESVTDNISSQNDDDNGDWIPLSTVGNYMTESEETVSSSLMQNHQMPGYEPAQMNGSNSVLPIAPMLVGSGSRQRPIDNNGVLPFTFYATGPPVPIVMVPFYNLQTETGNSVVSTSQFDKNEEFDNFHSSQSDPRLDSTENINQPEISNPNSKEATSSEPVAENKSDILTGNLDSHWQNLQYGWICQNPRPHGPMVYPSPFVGPPMYIQDHFPWDGPGRPLSTNADLFTQLMGYGPRIIPVSPLQPGSNRPSGVYPHYGVEIPRYRGGTGTYLPNPKISFRDRQTSNSRNNRGNFGYDRKDNHGDREGNWNANSKQRFSGRSQGRSQVQKLNTRLDLSTSSSQSDRPGDTFKLGSFLSNHSQNGPFCYSNSMHRGSLNVPCAGVWVSWARALLRYERRISAWRSSPELQRSTAKRNYQLKDVKLTPLSCPNRNISGRNYNDKISHCQTLLFTPHTRDFGLLCSTGVRIPCLQINNHFVPACSLYVHYKNHISISPLRVVRKIQFWFERRVVVE